MSGVPRDGEWMNMGENPWEERAEDDRELWNRALDEGYRDGWADAVEACARVAESFFNSPSRSLHWDIAAAIRALKAGCDEPTA